MVDAGRPPVSVIVPVLDEEQLLPGCLRALSTRPGWEILVVDGGSRDRTRQIARAHPGVRLVQATRGRAAQMNAGAQAARGDVLLFCHADCRPSRRALTSLEAAARRGWPRAGAFTLRLDGAGSPHLRLVELVVALRSRILGLPYGDQGIWLRRDCFQGLGGYREQVPCEDLDLVLRLRRRTPLRILPGHCTASARQWDQEGWLGATWRNVGRLWRQLAVAWPAARRATARPASRWSSRFAADPAAGGGACPPHGAGG